MHDGASSRRRSQLAVGVSVIAVAGCAWWASRQPAPALPSGAGNVALMLGSIAVYAVAMLGRGWRWDRVLRSLRIRHRSSDAYALTIVGQMGNTVLPARGGELLKIVLLAERSSARSAEVLGSIITERLLDVASLALMFALLAALQVGGLPGDTEVGLLAGGGLLVLVAVGFLYLRLRVAGRFERFAQRVRPIARASRPLLGVTGVSLGLLSCAVWCVDGAVLWLSAQALDVALTPVDAVAVVVLAGFSAIVPSAPGMIGTYDAAALFVLHRFGVGGGDAVSCLLLFRFVTYVPVGVAGLALMLMRYGRLRGALRRSSGAKTA